MSCIIHRNVVKYHYLMKGDAYDGDTGRFDGAENEGKQHRLQAIHSCSEPFLFYSRSHRHGGNGSER